MTLAWIARAFSIVATLLLIGIVITVFYLFHGGGNNETVDVIIAHKSTLAQVANRLHEVGIIERSLFFRLCLRFSGGTKKVRAGEFRFQKGMEPIEALRVLYSGEPIVHMVTIPEGWSARQIAELLKTSLLVNEERFLELVFSPMTIQKYQLNTPSLEGFLFPDTYTFSRVDGEEKIIERMVHRLFEKFDKPLREETHAKGWTVERLITLASIIEKETGIGSERELISSVFHNRLKKGMRLQSDPTTIYGIAGFNGNLTKKDLQTPTPYNTYTIKGLPPGPIASPGIQSIVAALRPASSRYLYFVSNKRGEHIFSESYKDHVRAVDSYQKRRTDLSRMDRP